MTLGARCDACVTEGSSQGTHRISIAVTPRRLLVSIHAPVVSPSYRCRTMRSIRPIVAWMTLTLAGSGAADAAGLAPDCQSRSPGNDALQVSCPVKSPGGPQRFRFKANFTGSHDDTMASMTATLDGAPLSCEAGSKTSLMGEDGDVSLECRFSAKDVAGTQHLLQVLLQWRHAQYTDFELTTE